VTIERLTNCCKRFDFTPLCCEGIPREDTTQEKKTEDPQPHGKEK